MSVAQANNAPSSKPVISGHPAALDAAESVAANMAVRLIEVEQKALEKFTYRLVALLSNDREWSALIPSITIDVYGGEITISSTSRRVEELEYGTPSTPMNSKLRPFLKEITNELKREFDQVLEIKL